MWTDCYSRLPPGVSSIFGRVDISPFPFVVIFRYDQDPSNPIKLSTKAELHHLIKFNNSIDIKERRKIRQSLRALNNQLIYAPTEILGTRYQSGLLKIHQNADCLWHGTNFSSGFKITISYNDGITRDGKKKGTLVQTGYDLGISDDLRSNHAITKLFRNNRKLLESRIDQVLRITEEYRGNY